MPSLRTWWIVAVAGVIWYRNGSILKNCILVRSPLPTGYVAGGIDYSTDCQTLRDPSSTHPLSESVNSCEDLTFWELYDAEGKDVVQRPVILSCDPNRKNWNTVMGPLRDPNPHGALWLYVPPPLSSPSIIPSSVPHSKPQRIELVNYPAGHDFHPLGVEVWPSYGGNRTTLYAVNHARAHTTIEQFSIDPSTTPLQATYIRTISSSWFVSPNALALTSENSFYVSNDHLITRRWPGLIGKVLPLVESLLALPLGFVAHVELNPVGNGDEETTSAIKKHEIVKAFIPFPNGVGLSPAKGHGQAGGDRLAIVSTSGSKIYVYERNKDTNQLGSRAIHTVPVPFSPDNVYYTQRKAEDGSHTEELIVGGHPNFLDLSGVAANKPGVNAGSWVASVLLNPPSSTSTTQFDTDAPVSLSSKIASTGENWTLETFFQSHGDEEAGGFGTSTRGLRDPETGDVFVSGLYARDGAIACHGAARKPQA